jgi:hypothetical protein
LATPSASGVGGLVQFDHRADLRIANRLASVINARKPISKYAPCSLRFCTKIQGTFEGGPEVSGPGWDMRWARYSGLIAIPAGPGSIYSEIMGNSVAVAISNAYYPDNRTAADAVSKLGMQVGVDMAANVLKEFWPEIERRFRRQHR